MTNPIEQLASRVEAGESSHQLGIDISNALFVDCPAEMRLLCVESAQGNLSAVAALQERLLPEWSTKIEIAPNEETKFCVVMARDGNYIPEDGDVSGYAPTEIAARLVAILRAYGKE